MLTRFGSCIALVVLLGSGRSISVARAAPRAAEDDAKQRAKLDYLEGMKSYNLNEYEPALVRFKSAYRNFPDASFLFNIAV